MVDLVEPQVLKTLVPPSALNAENFHELARKAVVERLPAGRSIFRAGESDKKTVYLLKGEVELVGEQGVESVVRGGTEASRHPLANHQPRLVTARARTEITFTRFDTDLLDILLTWDQLSGIEVSDLTQEGETDAAPGVDWMSRILQSKAFMQIPPANIQQMFMRLEELPLRAGDVVIRQGEPGDYYYIIGRGRCQVTRHAAGGQDVVLAELADGDAFGEEALLTEDPRNATVTMLTDGTLMRLSKQDFEDLLKAPMQKEVDYANARELVRKGAVLLDVRLETEHRNSAIKGSVNVPIYMLRLRAEHMDKDKEYILYCDTGRRSSAAAYLLTERGFAAYVLQGGLSALKEARTA